MRLLLLAAVAGLVAGCGAWPADTGAPMTAPTTTVPGQPSPTGCGPFTYAPLSAPTVTTTAPVPAPMPVDPTLFRPVELDGVDAEEVVVTEGDGVTRYSLPAELLVENAAIRPAAEPALRDVAASIARRSPDALLEVHGHTAPEPDGYDQLPSEVRAAVVGTWLVDEGGVTADRVSCHGLGALAPAPAGPDERVEVLVVPG